MLSCSLAMAIATPISKRMRQSFPIVRIWISAGTTQAVGDVVKAAQVLLEHWPKEFAGTEAHLAAREACLDAWDDNGDPMAARAALIAAAREADILADV